ncbi:MAG: carbohydrate binding domain-containing protein [Phycisphaeraceae bacterium]|nr:carbohydrate binding domain-containing protein [Phycisphaeraceae bacterium]
MAPSTTNSISKNICYLWLILGLCTSPVFAKELLRNHDFSKGLKGWSVYIHKTLQESAKHHIDQSVLTIEIESAKSSDSLQLIHPVALKEGQRYKLSFDAKIDSKKAAIQVVCAQTRPPFNNYGLGKQLAFSTTWKRHHFTFVAKDLVQGNTPSIRLFLGKQSGKTLLRNFSLTEDATQITIPKINTSAENTSDAKAIALAQKKSSLLFHIVPTPKQLDMTSGSFQLGQKLFVQSSRPKATALLEREVTFITGKQKDDFQITAHPTDEPFLCVSNTAGIDLFENLQGPPPFEGGYTLAILPEGFAIKGFDDQGLRNGIQSLLQVLEQSPDGKMTQLTVRDLPDLTFRAMHVPLRRTGKSDEDTMNFYRWSFRRLGRYKYTHVCLMLRAPIKLKSHPELWPDAKFTPQQIKQIIEIGNNQGLVVFPELKTMGKFFTPRTSQADLQPYADLLERKVKRSSPKWKTLLRENLAANRMTAKKRTKEFDETQLSYGLNVASSKVLPLVRDCIDEIYELFNQPKLFHIGMDESFTFGTLWPKEISRGKMFADYANALNRHLKEKGCRTLIWGDMLLNHIQFPYFFAQNGGPPRNTSQALPLLDKDIIIADWQYGGAVLGVVPQHYPSVSWFRQNGFDVISASWYKPENMANLARDNGVTDGMGLMGTSWAMYMTYYIHTQKGPLPVTWRFWNRKKVQDLRELGIYASTAEAAWSLIDSKTNIAQYDNVEWEKRWLPHVTAK